MSKESVFEFVKCVAVFSLCLTIVVLGGIFLMVELTVWYCLGGTPSVAICPCAVSFLSGLFTAVRFFARIKRIPEIAALIEEQGWRILL